MFPRSAISSCFLFPRFSSCSLSYVSIFSRTFFSSLLCQFSFIFTPFCSFSSLMNRNIISDDFMSMVGRTPLIKLRKASEITKCNIYGKCEFANPGGSVKDRPACYIIKDAEEKGLLKKGEGGMIVEGSAGNTAIGLALAAKRGGYKTLCVIPQNQSYEKIEALQICGCTVISVPFEKVWHPNHFVNFSKRLAQNLNAVWGRQFDNLANRQSHYETTGPEIWEQLDGNIDGFVSVVGTGGTLTGISSFLKQKNREIKVALADVPGAVLYRFYTFGVLQAVGSSITENIGQGRVTGNLVNFSPDLAYEIPDEESLPWCFQLLNEEGLQVGMSSGVNVAGAVRLAKQLGPNHTVVTLLCDSGQRYAKKLYNPEFLKSLNLPFPEWMNEKPIKEQEDMEKELKDAYIASFATADEIADAVAKNKHNSQYGSKI